MAGIAAEEVIRQAEGLLLLKAKVLNIAAEEVIRQAVRLAFAESKSADILRRGGLR